MATLYRKYRPQNFSEVLGQNHIKIVLENEILHEKISQAYLFCGPRAVGKTTLARIFAKAVNCENKKTKTAEPCNQCQTCLGINEGKNLDIIEIDAASNTGVDNVRDNIISFARVNTSQIKYKVFIIDEVHMLSISAFNALLKTLEEPPKNVIFILCTTEIHKVPATIISRCQRFDFKHLSISDMVKKLQTIVDAEKVKVEKGILEMIARQSSGFMRDAESLLGQIIAVAGKNITKDEASLVLPHNSFQEIIDLLSILNKKDATKAIEVINHLVSGGINLNNFTFDLIEILRKLLLGKINPALTEKLSLDFGHDIELRLSEISGEMTTEKIVLLIESFNKARLEIKSAPIPQLPLELAIINFCFNSPEDRFQVIKDQLSLNPVRKEKSVMTKNIEKKIDDLNLNQTEVEAKWDDFLLKIKPFNHSLSFVLQNCQPKDLAHGCLKLCFKYKFHRDRINEIETKNIVERVLGEIFNGSLQIETVLDENLELNNRKPAPENEMKSESSPSVKSERTGHDFMDNLLETFGGQVIN
jgi:DNA polymerase-3 subunit gamma/tau